VDGIAHKDQEVIIVLTTNHVEKINAAMLRPGRLDAVISVTPPDSEAVQRLVTIYARGILNCSEPVMQEIGDKLQGHIPAVIREVVERAKLISINNNGHETGKISIGDRDIRLAAKSVLRQVDILRSRDVTAPAMSIDTLVQRAVLDAVGEKSQEKILRIDKKVERIERNVC